MAVLVDFPGGRGGLRRQVEMAQVGERAVGLTRQVFPLGKRAKDQADTELSAAAEHPEVQFTATHY